MTNYTLFRQHFTQLHVHYLQPFHMRLLVFIFCQIKVKTNTTFRISYIFYWQKCQKTMYAFTAQAYFANNYTAITIYTSSKVLKASQPHLTTHLLFPFHLTLLIQFKLFFCKLKNILRQIFYMSHVPFIYIIVYCAYFVLALNAQHHFC